jgi:uncharacterized protein (UPF0332 family)
VARRLGAQITGCAGRGGGAVRVDAGTLIAEAAKAIEVGRRELEAGNVEAGADHACAAMLRTASACLSVDGLAPEDPGAVCVAYGQRFSRTGRLYSAYHRWLLDAMDLRKASTGDLPARIDASAAATAIERAGLFRDAVVLFVDRSGRGSSPARPG